jgi:predicted transcriptional regulator
MDKPNRTEEEIEWSNQFARKFFRIIIQMEMPLSHFFEVSGYSEREFNRILKGSNPSLHKICKIAKGLNVPVHVLMDFSKEKKDRFRYTGITKGPSEWTMIL